MFALKAHKADWIMKSALIAPLLVLILSFVTWPVADGPFCSKCASSSGVYCTKAKRDSGNSDVTYGGEVQEWTCSSCHRKWNQIPINLHRAWGYGCTQTVYY